MEEKIFDLVILFFSHTCSRHARDCRRSAYLLGTATALLIYELIDRWKERKKQHGAFRISRIFTRVVARRQK